MDILLDFFHRLAPWAFIVLLVCAGWSDARSYLIPDRISILIGLLYPAYALGAPETSDFAGAIIVAAIVLLVATGLFATDLMGGGDVKLMSAAALWAGTDLILPFLLTTALAGGLLSTFVLLRLRLTVASGRPSAALQRRVPYGVAIAAGGIYVATRLIGL